MRNLPAIRDEVETLDDADLIVGYRCEETSSSAALADYGPDGYNLTAASNAPAANDLVTLEYPGARNLDGTNDYFYSGAASTYTADLMGNLSFWGFFDLDSGLNHALCGAGGSGGGASSANNILLNIGINGGGALYYQWQYATNTYVSGSFSGLDVFTAARYFVGVAREVDPLNANKVRIRAYAFNLDTGTYSTDFVDDLTPPDSTTNSRIAIGRFSSLSAALEIDGRIGDLGFARVALTEEWFREQAGRALRPYHHETMFAGSEYKTHARVRVKDSEENWIDLRDMVSGDDFVVEVEWSEHVDDALGKGKFKVFRARDGWSLGIEHRTSPFNLDSGGSYAPLLKTKAEVKFDWACIPHDGEPDEWDWKMGFHGFISSPDWSDWSMSIDCIGRGLSLRDMFMPYGNTFSTGGGTALETAMQDMIDEFDVTSIGYLGFPYQAQPQLYTPVSPSFNVTEWFQQQMGVLDALRTLSEQIGFDTRFVFDDIREESRPTLYEPDRANTTPDWTFADGEYLKFDKMTLHDADIRNSVQVIYGRVASTDALGMPVRSSSWVTDSS